MKKGCFIKSVIILTILTAAVLYIVKYKLHDFVIVPVKQKLVNVIVEDWSKEIDYVKNSNEKDSLKSIVADYLSSIDTKDIISDEKFKLFMTYIAEVVRDSVVETSELNFISEKIKTELQNERSTQN